MSQAYSDPKRETDPHALPDVEVFYHDCTGNKERCEMAPEDDEGAYFECWGKGFYYWFCFPGCMPDSEPMGPFETKAEALADAREGMEDDEV